MSEGKYSEFNGILVLFKKTKLNKKVMKRFLLNTNVWWEIRNMERPFRPVNPQNYNGVSFTKWV